MLHEHHTCYQKCITMLCISDVIDVVININLTRRLHIVCSVTNMKNIDKNHISTLQYLNGGPYLPVPGINDVLMLDQRRRWWANIKT